MPVPAKEADRMKNVGHDGPAPGFCTIRIPRIRIQVGQTEEVAHLVNKIDIAVRVAVGAKGNRQSYLAARARGALPAIGVEGRRKRKAPRSGEPQRIQNQNQKTLHLKG